MKPATPLPWGEAEGNFITASFVNDDPNTGEIIAEVPCQHPHAKQNLAYLIHVANAYPKLVEALRLVCCAKNLDESIFAASDGKDLLRELGEL